MLISLNYLILYAVVIVPFVLLINHEKKEDEGHNSCEGKGGDCLSAEE